MSKTKGEVCPVNKLKLSINGKEGRIRIGRGVVDVLRDSQFLSIYMSPDNDAIMVKPCEEKEFLSIKIGDRSKDKHRDGLRLYSLAFVTDLMDKRGWDFNRTYHMTGEYVKSYNAVVFFLKNATVVSDAQTEERV